MSATVVILLVVCLMFSSSLAGGAMGYYKGMIPGTYLYNMSVLNETVKKLKKDDVCDREKLVKKSKELKLGDKIPEQFEENSIVTETTKNIKAYAKSCDFASI